MVSKLPLTINQNVLDIDLGSNGKERAPDKCRKCHANLDKERRNLLNANMYITEVQKINNINISVKTHFSNTVGINNFFSQTNNNQK